MHASCSPLSWVGRWMRPCAGASSRKHEAITLGEEHNRLRQRRRATKPNAFAEARSRHLHVVDHAEKWPLGGHLGDQPQYRRTNQRTIRRRAGSQAEGDPQRVALRIRNPLKPIERRRAQPMRAGEREGALAVHAREGPELEQDDAIPKGRQPQRLPVRGVEPRVDADQFRGAAQDRQPTRSILVRRRAGGIARKEGHDGSW
jgi:hypothetical protein